MIERDYSQLGEQRILEQLYELEVSKESIYAVEFGASDGEKFSNTKFLDFHENTTRLLMDMEPKAVDVHAEKILPSNVLQIFAKHNVPEEFWLLSLDIDGLDYWVLKEILTEYKPTVICVEYNSAFTTSVTIPNDETFSFQRTAYHGASFYAFKNLCSDYFIAYETGLNIILIRKSSYLASAVSPLQQEPKLGRSGWPLPKEPMILVEV